MFLAWYPRSAANDTGEAGETLHGFGGSRSSPVKASEFANPVQVSGLDKEGSALE